MARATRSSAANEKQSESAPPPTRGKAAAASKKRKRGSVAEIEDQPSAKQLRSGDSSVKDEEDNFEAQQPSNEQLPTLQNAGDVPINSEDAQKILDILEMIDTQGLLDRVFPLHSNSAEASGSQPTSYSFRTLLGESSQHTLFTLRSAVQHLFPISSHPRARPSTPAAQQRGFCTLALSLLDQASFNSVTIPLDLESIFPIIQDADTSDIKADIKSKAKSKSPLPPSESSHDSIRQRKYALMQKFSGNEWWTSLNSEFGAPSIGLDGTTLKDLGTAHAELISILPAPSSTPETTNINIPIPNLGSYAAKKVATFNSKGYGPRRTSTGRFLDYGSFASFAPTYEGAGVEVGRRTLAETVWRWEQRRKMREAERSNVQLEEAGDVAMEDIQEVESTDKAKTDVVKVAEDSLDGLLPPEEISSIKAALGTLELEDMVQELLERNQRALRRLAELQKARLGAEGGGTSQVEEGSEEWETAQNILNSLTILASLRPRSSKEDLPPLVPTQAVLRKLHRTLPAASTQGWYGTLPASRPSALRDDATIHIKSGAIIPAPDVPIAAPQAGAAQNNVAGYNYNQAYAAQPFRAGTYPPPQQQPQYKPGQSTYYPQGQYAAQPTQAGQTTYYPNQQYGQGQYQVGAYNYYQSGQAATNPAPNGHGTPQPTGATTNFYSYNATQPQAQRAVANTVTAAAGKAQQPAMNGAAPPTLPLHLRNTTWAGGSTSQPGTPGGFQQQTNYYGSFQQPATPAR